MKQQPRFDLSGGLSQTGIEILAPTRSVIIEMIMVQLLSIILTMFALIAFRGQDLGTQQVTMVIIALFGSGVFLGSIYSRLTS